MKIQPGIIVRVGDTITEVLSRADGVMQWRCDDGWVHHAKTMLPTTEAEQEAHRAKVAQSLALIDEFEQWMKRHP